jgi:hypothetical protein
MKIPRTERHLLSKSTFMMGKQCSKRLWLYKKRPGLAAELSGSQEMVFEKGIDVGKLFPGGN